MSEVTFFSMRDFKQETFLPRQLQAGLQGVARSYFLDIIDFVQETEYVTRPVNLVRMFPRSTRRKISSTHTHDRCKSGFDPFLPTADGLLCNLIMMSAQHFVQFVWTFIPRLYQLNGL